MIYHHSKKLACVAKKQYAQSLVSLFNEKFNKKFNNIPSFKKLVMRCQKNNMLESLVSLFD